MKTPQQKAWETRRRNVRKNGNTFCVICGIHFRRTNAKTCDQHCAGKLAWRTRLSN